MRHDHTAWLTHFVRDRSPEQDFPHEDLLDPVGGELEPDASAFSVLTAIIRLGGIVPGRSFRNGRTTIYGGQPAICATEMPLYAFAQYARRRADAGKVSAYGVAFLKNEFYLAGGRPVLYGLSIDNPTLLTDTPLRRVFQPTVLPPAEQYRYVAYNPTGVNKWVDWSHEREWRWVPTGRSGDDICAIRGDGCFDAVPALPLFRGKLEGGHFTRVCIIVWTHDEASRIREMLTGFYFAETNNYDTLFDPALIERSHIIVLQEVIALVEAGNKLSAQTIEGLDQANLLKPITINAAPPDAAMRVKDAFEKAGLAAKAAADAYAAKSDLNGGYCGWANATTTDVGNALVQYLLRQGNANGPYDGRVHIDFPRNYPAGQSLDYNEAGVNAACAVLSAELGFEVYCQSVAN